MKTQCKFKGKRCYNCGDSGHDAKECDRVGAQRNENERGEVMIGDESFITREIGNLRKQLGRTSSIQEILEKGIQDNSKRIIATQTPDEWMTGQNKTWADKVGSKAGGTRMDRRNEGMESERRRKEASKEKGATVLISTGKQYKETFEEIK
ncbi:hypothetical protein ANTRET_LOCUS359 [Anthophora retusa]